MTLVQPTVEMQQHIRSELNEDVSTREKDLEHIKEWLRLQPHLPQFQGELLSLTRYIRAVLLHRVELITKHTANALV